MSNWTGNSAPNWYQDVGDERINEKPYHSNDEGSLFQTDRGWEREIKYTDQHGRTRTKRYVVVADRQAQTDSGHIIITDVRIANATDYSTTPPTVAGSTAGDSYDYVITFNQAVALGDSFTWDVETTGTVSTATYKSGNMTNQITLTVDTSGEASALPIALAVTPTVGLDAWDAQANAAFASPVTIAAAANTADLNGFPFYVLASDAVVTGNTQVE